MQYWNKFFKTMIQNITLQVILCVIFSLEPPESGKNEKFTKSRCKFIKESNKYFLSCTV